jgi:hypothetical protein
MTTGTLNYLVYVNWYRYPTERTVNPNYRILYRRHLNKRTDDQLQSLHHITGD